MMRYHADGNSGFPSHPSPVQYVNACPDQVGLCVVPVRVAYGRRGLARERVLHFLLVRASYALYAGVYLLIFAISSAWSDRSVAVVLSLARCMSVAHWSLHVRFMPVSQDDCRLN